MIEEEGNHGVHGVSRRKRKEEKGKSNYAEKKRCQALRVTKKLKKNEFFRQEHNILINIFFIKCNIIISNHFSAYLFKS